MEEERFRELVKIITRFNMDGPPDWKESLTSVKCDEYRKLLDEFRSEFRLVFPEWHFTDGKFVGDKELFGWGNGDSGTVRDGVHSVLREAWARASAGDTGRAGSRLAALSQHFGRRAKNAQGSRKQVLSLMAETLKWLHGRAGSLKVCENPECATMNTYFFKVYNNDRYCSSRCISKAKALRKAKREAESLKTPKKYTKSDETRRRMSDAATKRHADDAAKKLGIKTFGDMRRFTRPAKPRTRP